MNSRFDRRKERRLLREVYYRLMDHWLAASNGNASLHQCREAEAELVAAVDRLQAFDSEMASSQQFQTAEVMH